MPLQKILAGIKINISVLGYGHIGFEVVNGIEKYNRAFQDNQITIQNILIKDKSKYDNQLSCFTENPDDIISNKSDLVLDLLNNIDYSLEYLPKVMQSGKSIVISGKIFLSEHCNFIFKEAEKHDVKLLIGSCISSDLPINISVNNPYYAGKPDIEKRGNSSSEVAAAIIEDIFYFYS